MRTAIVTGANGGVGLETARGLAKAGHQVVLAVRDVEKGERALADIAASVPGARLDVMRLDVSDLDDVRRFAREVLAFHPEVHVLVNNAGIHTARRRLTRQGHESTLATNHLGHFLLTHLVLDALRRGAPSRVVNVASEAHRYGRLRLGDLQGIRWSGWQAYAQSKLANVLFTYALARRLEGTGVSVFAVHPGSVRTRWARDESSGVFRFGVALASPFLLSPARGARTSLYAALSPELDGKSGLYLVRSKPAASSAASRDEEAQEALWRASEALVGLNPR